MKKRGILTIGAATAIAIGVAFAMQAGTAGSEVAAQQELLTVETKALREQDSYGSQTLYPGRVRALRRSQLGFERGGLLAGVRANEGERVAAGEILAKLDQRALRAQIAAAKANVSAAQAAQVDAQANADLSQATINRQQQLLAKGHISQQRFDDVQFSAASALARVNTAKAQVLQAKAQMETAAVTLALADLRAPFDGVIVRRMADEGTVLAPGTPIFDFEETGRYEFVTGVPAGLVGQLIKGQSAQVTLGGEQYTGRVKQIVGALDGATRTAQLILDLPESARVVSGQVGNLAVTVERAQTGFWVPIEALQEGERGLWSVFVAKPKTAEEGSGAATLQRHPVELYYAELDRAFVNGSIADGDAVVVSGLNRLISGQNVRAKSTLTSR